jgi:alkylhydroperoxidase family enzyme
LIHASSTEPTSSSLSTRPLIDPLDDDELRPDVAAAILDAQRDGVLSSTVLPRIWARRPDLASAQIALQSRFYDSSVLPGRLLELIRLQIASLNHCQVCQISRKSDDVTEDDIACLSDDHEHFTPAERAALSFATLFSTDHLTLGEDEIRCLREHFSDEEVVELGMFAGLMVGSGRLARALRAFDD